MKFPRGSGILLHPTSLPTRYGIGDLGPATRDFIDFLAASGQTYWQTLPLSPTGAGNSPYSSYSAFAGDTLLISPESLVADGLVDQSVLDAAPAFDPKKVEFDRVREWKNSLLAEAFEHFRSSPTEELTEAFNAFCREHFWWLDDYATFIALKNSHDGAAWFQWAEPLRLRDEGSVKTVRSQLAREIQAEQFAQFLFFREWWAVRRYANERKINIIGDIPIFVAQDSADVWCNQSMFKLNDDGSPTVVAGVPPDYFSETGQLWGNPIYDWQAMIEDNLGWWTARIAFALRTANIVRLDHFIGFIRNWEVPADEETAVNGTWADVPGTTIFEMLRRRLGELPLIAEDLGAVTPEVEALRDSTGIPGMRILQNAFGGDAYNRDLPHNYVQNCVAYTGTHDNDTSAGWLAAAPKNVREHALKYLRSGDADIVDEMIRTVQASVADIAIIPLQDLLGLGSDARMNLPATTGDNWSWRYETGAITDDMGPKLLALAEMYGRGTAISLT